MPLFAQCQDPLKRKWTVYLNNLASLQILKMGLVKGLWPALGLPMICFNGFQQGTPLLVIISMGYYSYSHLLDRFTLNLPPK
jgi:hypothetical protein